MSGPHGAGKGTNRRSYDSSNWNNSPLWDNIGPTKKNGKHSNGDTEEGVLPLAAEGELSEHTGPNEKDQ